MPLACTLETIVKPLSGDVVAMVRALELRSVVVAADASGRVDRQSKLRMQNGNMTSDAGKEDGLGGVGERLCLRGDGGISSTTLPYQLDGMAEQRWSLEIPGPRDNPYICAEELHHALCLVSGGQM